MKNTIFIYEGPGASKEGLLQTQKSLKSIAPNGTLIKTLSTYEALFYPWEREALLFVLPGGADLPYVKKLHGSGAHKIRTFVESGGTFLGICAGAYFAGSYVLFDKASSKVIQGPRELGFFPGTVEGPLLAPYDPKNSSGTKAAPILWHETSETTHVFYNGGGYFVDAHQKTNIKILASYQDHPDKAAILECQVGEGKAILTSVHLEYDPLLLNPNDPHLQALLPPLKRDFKSNLLRLSQLFGFKEPLLNQSHA